MQALSLRFSGVDRTAPLAENVVEDCCQAITFSRGLQQLVSHSLSSARVAALLQCCYGRGSFACRYAVLGPDLSADSL